MSCRFKKIAEIEKKDYDVYTFASEFSIDSDGYMYAYIDENRIAKLGIDGTVKVFTLPGYQYCGNPQFPTKKPIILNESIFHVRYEGLGGVAYVLKTDKSMNEQRKLYLSDNPHVLSIFENDGHIFLVQRRTVAGSPTGDWDISKHKDTIAAKRKRISESELHMRNSADEHTREIMTNSHDTVHDSRFEDSFAKMNENCELCWEYTIPIGTIYWKGVTSLSDGSFLVPTETWNYIEECDILDKNGNISNIIDPFPYGTMDTFYLFNFLNDMEGNVCFHTCRAAYTLVDGTFVEPMIFIIVTDASGKELYRKSIDESILNPISFRNKFFLIYCELQINSINRTAEAVIMEINLLNNEKKELKRLDLGAYHLKQNANNYVVYKAEKKDGVLYCYDNDDNSLWEKIIRTTVLFLDIRDNCLYFTGTTKMGIYSIIQK